MDFKFTKEQEALREEFDQFFREEMKNAPKSWAGGFDAIFESDEGFAFTGDRTRNHYGPGWFS